MRKKLYAVIVVLLAVFVEIYSNEKFLELTSSDNSSEEKPGAVDESNKEENEAPNQPPFSVFILLPLRTITFFIVLAISWWCLSLWTRVPMIIWTESWWFLSLWTGVPLFNWTEERAMNENQAEENRVMMRIDTEIAIIERLVKSLKTKEEVFYNWYYAGLKEAMQAKYNEELHQTTFEALVMMADAWNAGKRHIYELGDDVVLPFLIDLTQDEYTAYHMEVIDAVEMVDTVLNYQTNENYPGEVLHPGESIYPAELWIKLSDLKIEARDLYVLVAVGVRGEFQSMVRKRRVLMIQTKLNMLETKMARRSDEYIANNM